MGLTQSNGISQIWRKNGGFQRQRVCVDMRHSRCLQSMFYRILDLDTASRTTCLCCAKSSKAAGLSSVVSDVLILLVIWSCRFRKQWTQSGTSELESQAMRRGLGSDRPLHRQGHQLEGQARHVGALGDRFVGTVRIAMKLCAIELARRWWTIGHCREAPHHVVVRPSHSATGTYRSVVVVCRARLRNT